VRTLEADPAVTGVTQGYALPQISINHLSVGAVGAKSLKGGTLLSTVAGHVPDGPGQVALGRTTMHQLGAHIGSRVEVTIPSPTGGKRTSVYTVVGQISFPVLADSVGLGTGSAFTLSSFLNSACAPGPQNALCRQAALSNGGGLLVRVAPGPAGRATVRHYLRALGEDAATPLVPTSLINFGEAVNFPAIFGVMLAIFGAATLLHLLVVSVARRRREVGLLKVVGFVNGQVASSVGWQASTLALIGIVIGVPVGIAAGAAIWRAFAGNLGAVPVSVVPVWVIVVLAIGVAVVANLMAIGPALVATRARPSDLMRTA
jgi:FtsX-like permease family